MTMSSSVRMFRPVGQNDLEKIALSSWGRSPPRLEEQPIFYPVLNQLYAAQIARLEHPRWQGRVRYGFRDRQ